MFQQKNSHNIQILLYGFFLLGGLFWTIRLFMQTDGVINQDEIGHLIIAKNAWYHPEFLLDEWGRCVNTLFYFIPSLFGLTGARIFSIILSVLTIILTTQIVKIFEIKYYFLIPLFLWFQPFFGAHAFSILTEIPFSFILVSTILLTLKNKHAAASFLVGLLPLIRHEAILLTGLWCLYYLYLKKIRYISFAILPLLLYILLYYFVNHEFVYKIFFEPNPTDIYGIGTWFHYFKYLPDWAGHVILFFSLLGLITARRYGFKSIIFLSGYLLYYLTRIIIWKFGLYSSAGLYRALIPMAPAFAILASLGIKHTMQVVDEIIKNQTVTRAVKLLIFLIIIPSVIYHGVLIAAPYESDMEQRLMKQVVMHLEKSPKPFKKVIATHVWFYYYYFYNKPWTMQEHWTLPPHPQNIQPGTIVVWDAHFSERFGLSLDELNNPEYNFEKIMAERSGKVIVFYKP
jgi:hypothetical protein